MIAASPHLTTDEHPGSKRRSDHPDISLKLTERFMPAIQIASLPNLDNLPPAALLTRAQVATLSGFAIITLKKWARVDRGPKITRIEGRPRYRAADVAAWLNAQS